MAGAYYNEIDHYAAQWLRNLIAAGHIAPGDVDERSIEDVRPDDLRGYTQCHFFAGIGVWSAALRRAGWTDDRPVWTGSCPCQPFSAAGKGLGFDDERHLWPAWHWLIAECRPPEIFGEQVASKAVEPWIDLVQADVEALGYAFGCVPFPSAGVGAPHIRDRAYWVAYASNQRCEGFDTLLRQKTQGWESGNLLEIAGSREIGSVADADSWQRDGFAVIRGVERDGAHAGRSQSSGEPEPRGAASGLGDAAVESRERLARGIPGAQAQINSERCVYGSGIVRPEHSGASMDDERPSPTNGFWRSADWLLCWDEKFRPVEPGTFPLAHGVTARVGRLRAYGNAINLYQAAEFIAAASEALGATA